MKPSTPKTEVPPPFQLRKVVFRGAPNPGSAANRGNCSLLKQHVRVFCLLIAFACLQTEAANLPAPTLSTPLNGAANVSTTPPFSWSAVTGASAGYWLAVATSSAVLPTDATASTCPSCVMMVANSTTSYTPTSALSPGTTYYWRVRGRGPGTTYGNWSGTYSFTTQANRAPTLTLTSTSGASVTTGQSYSITVSAADADGNLNVVDVNWNDGSATPIEHQTVSGSSASVTFTRSFSTARTINWSATAYDTALLASGQLSGSFTVTDSTLPAPTLSTPFNGAANVSRTPPFSWSAVSGASAGYWLAVATSSGVLPTDATASTCPSCVLMVANSDTSYTPTTMLNAGTTYYWRVRGRGPGSIYGNWSSIFSFTTQANRAPTLTLTSTSGASVTTGQSYSITVSAADLDGNLNIVDVNWNDGSATPIEHQTVSGSSASVTFTRSFSTARTINWSATAYDTAGLASGELSGSFTVTGMGTVRVTANSSSGSALAASEMNAVILYASTGIEVARKQPPSSNPMDFTSVNYGGYFVDVYCWDMLAAGISFTHNSSLSTITTDPANPKRPLTVTAYYSDGTTRLPGATVNLDSWNGQFSSWTQRASTITDSSGMASFSAWPTTQTGEKYRIRVNNGGSQIGLRDSILLSFP